MPHGFCDSCLNDYGVLISRGEPRGEGQADSFYSVGRIGSRSLS